MRFSTQQLVIDTARALIFIAVLVVPMFATQVGQQQQTNVNPHRVTASATHLRAAQPVTHVAHSN